MVVGVGWRVGAAITGPEAGDCLIIQVIQLILQQLDVRKMLFPQLPFCQGHKLTDFYFTLEQISLFLRTPTSTLPNHIKRNFRGGLSLAVSTLPQSNSHRSFPVYRNENKESFMGIYFYLFWKWLFHLSANLFISPLLLGLVSRGFHHIRGPVHRLFTQDSLSIHSNVE